MKMLCSLGIVNVTQRYVWFNQTLISVSCLFPFNQVFHVLFPFNLLILFVYCEYLMKNVFLKKHYENRKIDNMRYSFSLLQIYR